MKERQLYDYQLDMKRRVDETFGSHRSVMVQMPTGTGKTCLLVACVRAWLSQNEGTVWIVVHRRELVEQIVGTLQEEDLVGDRVRVFSIQWLSRHEGELAERPGLLVIDEAHHAVAKTYKAVVEACSGAKVLGLTATPCRLTRRGFTDLFEVLLQSWPYDRFIAEGRLSLYDYMSGGGDHGERRGGRAAGGGTVAGAPWSRWRLLAAGDERAAGREAEYRAPLRYGVALCTGEEGRRLCD